VVTWGDGLVALVAATRPTPSRPGGSRSAGLGHGITAHWCRGRGYKTPGRHKTPSGAIFRDRRRGAFASTRRPTVPVRRQHPRSTSPGPRCASHSWTPRRRQRSLDLTVRAAPSGSGPPHGAGGSQKRPGGSPCHCQTPAKRCQDRIREVRAIRPPTDDIACPLANGSSP